MLNSVFPQGLNKDHIFTHHGGRYMHNMISLYDQQFNRRYTVGGRRWDRHRLAWLPEASDNPIQGEFAFYAQHIIVCALIVKPTVLLYSSQIFKFFIPRYEHELWSQGRY